MEDFLARGYFGTDVDAARARFDALIEKLDSGETLTETERKDLGEAQSEIAAMDVAARDNLTAEQRKNTRPDIDRSDVVFADVGEVSYSFDVTQEDIDRYVDNAYAKQNDQDYKKYAVADEKLIKDVAGEIDITGYAHALRDNDIRHIRNSHGENTNEKYPVTKEDLGRIPRIVLNYDKVFVKSNARGTPGIVYVKVGTNNVVYYVEAVTQEYHNEKLLVNKQMIKTGIDEIPNLRGLIDAINKKESSSQYLADLKKIREAYVQDVKENYPNNSIAQNSEKSTPRQKKILEKSNFPVPSRPTARPPKITLIAITARSTRKRTRERSFPQHLRSI